MRFILEKEKTLELVVYSGEGEDVIIWIWKKFISKVLERESCEAKRNERKRLLFEYIHTPGSGDLVRLNGQNCRSVHEKEINWNLGKFWSYMK